MPFSIAFFCHKWNETSKLLLKTVNVWLAFWVAEQLKTKDDRKRRRFRKILKLSVNRAYYGVSPPQIQKLPSARNWTNSAIKSSVNAHSHLCKFVLNIFWKIVDMTICLLIKQDVSNRQQHSLNNKRRFSSKTNYIFLSSNESLGYPAPSSRPLYPALGPRAPVL